MKNKKIIVIIVLIGIIIGLVILNLNSKNINIAKQELDQQQLGEITNNNVYVSMESHMSEVNDNYRKYIIKDGIVQDGFTLVYSNKFTEPTFENGYIDTHGNRSIGFDGVDVTDYDYFFIKSRKKEKEVASSGFYVSASLSVSNAYEATRQLNSTCGSLLDCIGKYNIGYVTGTSGDSYGYYIYDMWLE